MGWLLLAAGAYFYFRNRRRQELASDEVGQVAGCTETRPDGPWEICLSRSSDGWRWSAERSDTGDTRASDDLHENRDDALVAAWMALAPLSVPFVRPGPAERHGMTMATNGFVTVSDQPAYMTRAPGVLDQAQLSGDDVTGQVISLVQDAFGELFNPLRLTIDREGFNCETEPQECTLQAAAGRLAGASGNPVERARAVFGLSA